MIKFILNNFFKEGMKMDMLVCLAIFVLPSLLYCDDNGVNSFKFKVGHYEIISLFDASISINAELVKDADPVLVKRLMPDGSVTASDNVFLIKTGTHTILVDSGFGVDFGTNGHLLQSMAKAGISPDDIDIILMTHLHRDHAGGLTKNGKAIFHKATLMLSKAEFDSIDPTALQKMTASIRDRMEPAIKAINAYAGHITTFIPGTVLFDGIVSVDLSGHTIGHTGYLVESEGEKLLIIGDLIIVTAMQFPYPDVSLVYDADKIKAVAIRKTILTRVSNEKIIIAGPHIYFPGIGRVIRENDNFKFIPVK